jgi:pectate lyase
VDDDGDADFNTVQGALNYAMKNLREAAPVTINVKNGVYDELLYLRGKDNVTIKGESRDGVVIRYTNNDTLNTGTGASQPRCQRSPAGGRAVMLVEASDMLVLDTLTLKNTTLRSAAISGQAETLYFNSDGRLVAKNASFYSEQDTLNLKGWAWFYHRWWRATSTSSGAAAARRCSRTARSARSATPPAPPAAATCCRRACRMRTTRATSS